MKYYEQDDFSNQGLEISNNMIMDIKIIIQGHFGNIPCLTIIGYDRYLIQRTNNLDNIGYMLQELAKFFELDTENGLDISEIKNIPCRIITDENDKIIAIGHFFKNRFFKMNSFICTRGEVIN